MACFTMVSVELDDTAHNRQARKELGLPLTGPLSINDAGRVRVEAGILKAYDEMLVLDPTAVIERTGNTLTVTVNR